MATAESLVVDDVVIHHLRGTGRFSGVTAPAAVFVDRVDELRVRSPD